MAFSRNQKQDTPMRYEQVRIPPNNDTKIPDQHLQPDQSPQLTLQLAPEPSQRLHPGFLPSLGLSVRAMNVLAQMDLETTAQFIALDEETLLRKRNCGKKTVAEIMAVVTRYQPSSNCRTGRKSDAQDYQQIKTGHRLRMD